MDSLNSCETLLQKMVGFDTVNSSISGRSGAEAELAAFLESCAKQLGLKTQRFAVDEHSFNLLISHSVSSDAPWLLFVSHLDTVSVDNMLIDPFAGHVRDGRLYGRGACDTKGSGAALLCAMADYANQTDSRKNAAILYTVQEEVDKNGVKTFVRRHLDTLDWKPLGVIVGEPTELRMAAAHNGVVRWTIRTQGVSAHSADPTLGRSAITGMVEIIRTIENQYIPSLSVSHLLTGKAQCSINTIRGGTQVNIVPDSCEIQIDRRVVPGENPDEVLTVVEHLLDALRRDNPELEVSQEAPFIDPPLDPEGNERFIAFVKTVMTELSLPDEPVGVGFGTEASTFSEIGIPAVVLGPGSIAQAHTCDEWIALDQLHRAADLYLQLMRHPMENVS